MKKMTLQEMRAKLQEAESKKGGNYEKGDQASYPFWDIPVDTSATIRLLPDGNDNNAYFWVERKVLKLPFPGVKGGDTNKQLFVTVPCMETFGKTCPVQEEIRPMWKDESMKDTARIYYAKKSYLYQGFVVQSALKEEKSPENPIRRFVLNKGIHDKIVASLMDPDFEHLPIDYENGLDFRITKTKKGQYSNYDTSSFARKSRALNDEELQAIETHGLFDLKSFLPKEPDERQIKVIFEMFEASLANDLFDPERFKDFKPYGMGKSDTTETTTDSDQVAEDTKAATASALDKLKSKAKVEEASEPVVTKLKPTSDEQASAPKKNPADVLAMLKARQAAK